MAERALTKFVCKAAEEVCLMSEIRLSKSIVGQREADAVAKVILEDGYLGMGSEVLRFEQDIASYLGVPEKRVVCVSSGTAALQLGLEAALSPGDEVLVQSLTYVASFMAITAAGMTPIACEVDSRSMMIDLDDAARRITKHTKAIMPIHYASSPGELNKIYQFAEKHGLRVIEDAAHAFGCLYEGKKIGSFGDIACFSFDGIKNITSGEGGALVTADEAVADRVRDARLLGVHKDSDARYAGKRSWEFDCSEQGYRYHMSNLFAAIGRVQLTRLDGEFAPKRQALRAVYINELESHDSLVLLGRDDNNIIPHIFPVLVKAGCRDKLKAYLEEHGVPAGIHYKPNHLLSYFSNSAGDISLPVTMQAYDELLTLPLHPDLTADDAILICRLISDFMEAV